MTDEPDRRVPCSRCGEDVYPVPAKLDDDPETLGWMHYGCLDEAEKESLV